ncbi:hypothetical protein ACIQU5_30440 [Streptomyces sp. NPDC090306]|uniref:hypothetical protein n=1 Tax=Streptomyces sp. NPDC090306 TaxID=3365961 RepID=UPI0038021DE3
MASRALRATVLVGLAGVLATGCGGGGGTGASGKPSEAVSGVSSPAVSGDPVSDKGLFAEKVRAAVDKQVGADEERFGSGDRSPCSTSSSLVLTSTCGAAADATAADAELALREINGSHGFATLDAVARKLVTSVRSYRDLGCATGPTAADTREACLVPAATIAHGFSDLHDGTVLGLSGK